MINKEDITSLCQECARIGWVTWDEYADDVEVSEMWPEALRNIYYNAADTGVALSRKNWLLRLWFVGPAYFYVKATNGVQDKDIKLLAWLPFLCMILPAGLSAIIADRILDR